MVEYEYHECPKCGRNKAVYGETGNYYCCSYCLAIGETNPE